MPYITPEQVKEIRNELKATFPDVKFSVRGYDYTSLHVSIMKSPFMWDKDYQQINHYYPDYENSEFLRDVINIANRNNGTESEDGDYGRIPKFYLHLSVGQWDKPHIFTGDTETDNEADAIDRVMMKEKERPDFNERMAEYERTGQIK